MMPHHSAGRTKRVLHVKPTDTSIVHPMLCGLDIWTRAQHGWVGTASFVSRETSDLDLFDYTYCKDCEELITPMEWLAYTEL